MSFTKNPDGMLAHIPVMWVDSYAVMADLGWLEGNHRVMLTLTPIYRNHHGSHPVFVVRASSVDLEGPPSLARLLPIPPRIDSHLIPHSWYTSAKQMSWQWVDAYLLQPLFQFCTLDGTRLAHFSC